MRRLALPSAALAGFALAVVPALADDRTVTTSGNTFSPNRVAVAPGDTVTIHNGGMGLHDLNWADGAPGRPDESPTDWSTERTFTSAGEYVFFCDVHGSATSGMRGTVVVGDAATTTTTTTTTGTTTPPPPPPTTTTTGTTTTGTSTTPPPPPAGGDTTPPRVTSARGAATRRAVTLRLTLSEAATVTVRVLRRGRRVARRTFAVEDGAVVLRVRRAFSPGRYAIRVAVVDEAGNRTSRSLTARVR